MLCNEQVGERDRYRSLKINSILHYSSKTTSSLNFKFRFTGLSANVESHNILGLYFLKLCKATETKRGMYFERRISIVN